MKKIFIIGGLILFTFGLHTIATNFCPVSQALAEQNVVLNNKISISKHPTKEEWLEVYITHKVKQFTDLHVHRVAVIVVVISEVKEMVITLTSANGQDEMSQTAKKIYADDVEKIVKLILEKYNWAQNYKLTVQYI
jgi:hypothetical protein